MTTKLERRRPTRDELAHYDPHKGAKSIHAAEAAEKFYAKAKDTEKLYLAIEAKLTLQAEFVLWWDTQAKKDKGGGDTRSTRNGSVTGAVRAKDFGLDKMTISRWRARLNDPDKFEQTLETARERCRRIVEADATVHVEHNSGENEWYTPAEYVEAARRVMNDGIDLDPATSERANEIIQAERIFTSTTNGLTSSWIDPRLKSCGRVWMNPPYSTDLVEQFTGRLVDYVRQRAIEAAVVLVNNATDTQWFRELAEYADAFCFKTGRVKFWSPRTAETATPLQGQVFVYFGAEASRFVHEFRPFGVVMVPA
jgi:phage N-6-adenine-methyltransferase